MRMSQAIVFLALVVGSGCGDSRKVMSPLNPSSTTPSVPLQSLHGYVADTAFRGVTGAKVEVLDGPQAGTSLVSDALGQFSYMGTFATPVTFRITKDGYITATETSKVSAPGGRPWVYVRLEAVATPANIAGEYMLTLTADSSCTEIPSEWRTRTYAATITPGADPHVRPDTLLTLTASGAPFLANRNAFQIGVSSDAVGFTIFYGEDYGLVEQLTSTTFLAYQGSAFTSIEGSSASTITARLGGIIDYCALQSETGWTYDCNSGARIAHATCESKNHQLILTRR